MISLQERTVRLIRWHRGRSRTSIFAKCICWLFVGVVGLTLLAARPARATVYTWSTGTSGNYSDPSNWTPSSPSPPPQSGDVAIFNQSGTYNVNGGGSTSIYSFESGTVTLNGAYSTDSKAFYSLYIGGGTLSMGANSSFGVNSLVAIGNNYDGSTAGGTLNVGTTSSLTIHDTSGFANITVGSALGGSGNVNVDGASALLDANGEMVVGYQSTGTVDILNGGLVQTDAVSASDSPGLAVGIDLGVQGTVLVDGMDPSMQHSSQLQNSGQITIGANGIGQLEARNSGSVTAGGDPNNPALVLGLNATGSGTVYVHNGGSISSNGQFTVGLSGTGSVTIETNGSVMTNSLGTSGGVENPSLMLGLLAESSGMVVVQNGGSLTTTGQMDVGGAGAGTLTINAGGTMTSNPQATTAAVFMANAANSQGTVTMNGGTWTVNGDMTVASLGQASVTIYSGATLDMSQGTGSIVLGAEDGGEGELILQGGQLLRPSSGSEDIVVGLAGRGQMEIHDGSQVSDSILRVAQETTSSATPSELLVEGLGPMPALTPSSLTLSKELSVGIDAQGQLTVQNGGQVLVTGSTSTFTAGSGSMGDGEIEVTGAGSTLNIAGQTILGDAGVGNAAVDTNGQISTGPTTIGSQSGSNGSADMESGGAWTVSGNLIVGDRGFGYVYLRQNGTLTLSGTGNQIILGNSAGGVGVFNIFGNGQLNISSDIVIGQSGAGTLSLSSGAVYHSFGSITLGGASTSGGTVDSDGGSTFTVNGDLTAGVAGSGYVNVTNASTSTISGSMVLAQQAGSIGNVTVDGIGSTLSVGGSLSVGGGISTAGGSSLVTLTNQGLLSVADTLTIWGAGTVDVTGTGIVNIGAGAAPSAGTVRVGGSGNLQDYGHIAGNILVDGGAMDISANSDSVGAITLASGAITGTTGVLTGTSYSVQSGSISANLGGSLSAMIKSTSGTVTLSGSNSFGGGTTVNAGTLIVANPNAVGTGGLTINNTALVKITTGTAAGPVVLPSLSINGGASPVATLDLTNSKMVLTNTSYASAVSAYTVARCKSPMPWMALPGINPASPAPRWPTTLITWGCPPAWR